MSAEQSETHEKVLTLVELDYEWAVYSDMAGTYNEIQLKLPAARWGELGRPTGMCVSMRAVPPKE